MSSDPSRNPMHVEGEAFTPPSPVAATTDRKRGRPLEMSRDEVLSRVQRLARRKEGLFRVHLTHSGLYARARRLFGSWSQCVWAAGLNYDDAVHRARGRSIKTRKVRSLRRFRPVP